MKNDFAARVAGWFFILSGALFWGGWMLVPEHTGQYFQPDIFPAIHKHLAYWISMYRMHLFGVVLSVLAVAALGSLVAESPARVLVWPGATVMAGGMFVTAVAGAFYYHFGAWGGLVYGEKTLAERQALVDSLLLQSEYLACLTRFGHVFSGLGLLVLAWGLMRWKLVPKYLGVWAAAMGVLAMGITMAMPEYPVLYAPVFHAFPFWMIAMGVTIKKHGLNAAVA
ncbi:MAG TPA: hypothetical protein VIH35_09440 [Kiritimatiellia bacterium]|jgi:hypothetical protein